MSILENRVAGKKILLTGGGSGIGRAVTIKLVEAGAKVAIIGRDRTKLDETNKLAGGKVHVLICDGTKHDQVEKTVTAAIKTLGGLDILINNAGMNLKERYIRNLTVEGWQQTIQGNLDSAFYFTRAVVPGMLAQSHGHIINISSISGKRANKLGGTAYAAAKFGMMALSHSVGLEEGENGIRTTAICPGEVNTPILDHRPTAVSDERRAVILKPEDVAEAVYYIANLRPGVSVPEMIITPSVQPYA
ncbi:MAG TPA: SDR family oxidoreductase [Gemmatales bacterium]|nr:SDR family oxidoreductase [Gemmatales bacterium]